MYVGKSEIIKIFSILNKNDIEYVLLRNIDDEFPHKLKVKKDIDILVNPNDKLEFKKQLQEEGWKQVKHPWDFGENFVFLYGMDKYEMYSNGFVFLDICYQLSCRSTNKGEWMPIDQSINESVWLNRKINTTFPWYEMGTEDQITHLLTRCIFDKKVFNEGYIILINNLLLIADCEELKKRLELVFFKFAPILLRDIRLGQYSDLVRKYIEFDQY